jgi:hypothetical protein
VTRSAAKRRGSKAPLRFFSKSCLLVALRVAIIHLYSKLLRRPPLGNGWGQDAKHPGVGSDSEEEE